MLFQKFRSLSQAVFCSPSGCFPISIHFARKLLKFQKAVRETGHSQTAIVPFGGALANFRLEEEHTGTISQEPLLALAPTHLQTKLTPKQYDQQQHPLNTNKKQRQRRIHRAFFGWIHLSCISTPKTSSGNEKLTAPYTENLPASEVSKQERTF